MIWAAQYTLHFDAIEGILYDPRPEITQELGRCRPNSGRLKRRSDDAEGGIPIVNNWKEKAGGSTTYYLVRGCQSLIQGILPCDSRLCPLSRSSAYSVA